MDFLQILQIILILFPSIILHECAHGWMAFLLGDSTAKQAGRLTLNPFKHIDPVGTVILPLLLYFSKAGILFGWAKPVPVNFMNLRSPRRDMMLVAGIGPLVNFVLAFLFSLVFKINQNFELNELLKFADSLNLLLAIFNLIPIPPLDGSRLVMGILPKPLADWYGSLESYGIFIVMALMYFGLLNELIYPWVVRCAYWLGVR